MFGLAADPGAAQAAGWSTNSGSPGAMPKVTDYALQNVVARNDRNTIYRATERASGRRVALKTVRIGSDGGTDRGLWRERFLREAAAAARLKHDFIVRVRAGGVQGEGDALTGWLAMEWVHGTDMSRYASQARLLPEGVVLGIPPARRRSRWTWRTATGHRPPAGTSSPRTCCSTRPRASSRSPDFGSARVADTAATRSGLIDGHAGLHGAGAARRRSTPGAQVRPLRAGRDLLFELLIGRRPFEADSMGDLLQRIAHQTPPRVRSLRPELPALLDDIVARLLAKTPGPAPRTTAREVSPRVAPGTPATMRGRGARAAPPAATEPTPAPASTRGPGFLT